MPTVRREVQIQGFGPDGLPTNIGVNATGRLLTDAGVAPFYTARQRVNNPLRYTVSGALELVSPVAGVQFTWFRALVRASSNANASWVRLVAGAASQIDADTELFNDENAATSTARVKLVPVRAGDIVVAEFAVDPSNPAHSLYIDSNVVTVIGTVEVIVEWG